MREQENDEICVRNPNVPMIDEQVEEESLIQSLRKIGYQKHPGNKCKGGWQPNLFNQRLLPNAKVRNQYGSNLQGQYR